jgi:hypothetical protein
MTRSGTLSRDALRVRSISWHTILKSLEQVMVWVTSLIGGERRQEVTNMKASDHVILAHHQPAATMWGRGCKDYDEVSFAISDALAHAAQRLNVQASVSWISPPEPAGPPAMWRDVVQW